MKNCEFIKDTPFLISLCTCFLYGRRMAFTFFNLKYFGSHVKASICAWWQSPRRSGSRISSRISNASGKERPVLCCLLVQSTVRTRYMLVIYWNHRYRTYTYTYINSVSVFDENAVKSHVHSCSIFPHLVQLPTRSI